MRKLPARLVGTLLVTPLIAVLAPTAASADPGDCSGNNFCAYDLNDYWGTELIDSPGGPDSGDYNIADNRLNSASNQSDHTWCAVEDGFPSNKTIYQFDPHRGYRNTGIYYNRTDWLYVRDGNVNCDI